MTATPPAEAHPFDPSPHYTPHRHYRSPRTEALECSQCGALVTELDRHETAHALTPTVADQASPRLARALEQLTARLDTLALILTDRAER